MTALDGTITSYAYDKNNRLTQTVETPAGGSLVRTVEDYYYDANGNTTSKLKSTISNSTTVMTPQVTISITSDNAELYEYSVNNMMVKSTFDSDITTYTYRPDGLRLCKTTGAVTTTHIWDGANIVADYEGTTLKAIYIRGINLIASKAGTTYKYYSYNGHGDVVQLSGSTGLVLWVYDYDAFGNEKAIAGQDADGDVNPFRYCGEYYDRETQTLYLRARYYDSSIGRFMSEDPIGDGLNWYTYCVGNPIGFIDPTGYAFTDQDKEQYKYLLSQGEIDKANTFRSFIDLLTTQYDDFEKDNDIYQMNETRYKAVQIRQIYYNTAYEDTYDYMHGQEALTFLGVHSVPPIVGPASHTCIVIMVSAGSEFLDNADFSNPLYGGKVKYSTIGAGGPLFGELESGINREPFDINLGIKKDMINLNISDSATISSLFSMEEYFKRNNNVNYTLFPFKSTSHNSNSFTHGILNAAGIPHTKPNRNLPGWDQPLESWRFKP